MPANGSVIVDPNWDDLHASALKLTYVCTFPYKTHPRSAEAEAYVRDYFSTKWPWPSEEAKQRFLKLDLDSVGSFWLPGVTYPMLEPAAAWLAVYFIIDDMMEHLSDAGQSVARIFPLTLGTVRPAPGDAFEEALFDIHERCRSAGDQADLERFTEASEVNIRWMKYVIKKSKEAIMGESVGYDTFEDFMAARVQEVGGPVTMPIVRWCYSFAAPEAIHQHPSVLAMEYVAMTHATALNDLYSLRKELKEVAQKKRVGVNIRVINSVFYLAEKHGWGLVDAVKDLERRLEGFEVSFLEAAEKAKRVVEAGFGKEGLVMVEEYISILKDLVAGNAAWHVQCGRYNNFDLY